MTTIETGSATPQTVDAYLELPYHLSVVRDRDAEGLKGWVAWVQELEGCVSQGATPSEAIENVRKAMADWVAVMLEDGKPIPLPRQDDGYSGRLLVRMPRSLHGLLARTAEDEGVSLNQLVVSLLSASTASRRQMNFPTIFAELGRVAKRAKAYTGPSPAKRSRPRRPRSDGHS